MYQVVRARAAKRVVQGFVAFVCACLCACENGEHKSDKDHDSGRSGSLFDAAQTDEDPATSGGKDASGGSQEDAAEESNPAGDAGGPINTRDAAVSTDAQTPRTDAGGGNDASVGGDAASPACTALFCEDFETGSLDTKRWTKVDNDVAANSVKVQSSMVAHGRYAAQAHAKGGSSRALMFLESLPQALRKHYFGRAHVRITNFPSEGGGHSAFVFSGSLDGYPWMDHHLEVGSYSSGASPVWQLTYWTGEGVEYIGSGGHIPKDTWFCLEWEFNDAPDQIAVWVDGDAAKNGASFRNINNNSTGLLGEFKALGLGFRTWHPDGAPDIDVYIDDIALDTKRIACVP